MKIKIIHVLILIICLSTIVACRVVKMGQFYLSENHQEPKQEIVNISNDPPNIFKFSRDERGYQQIISQIEYTPYTRKRNVTKSYLLSEYLDKETRTTAFIVIRRDTILYEQYFEGCDRASLLPSWSVAKSFTSALVGIAQQEGFL